jgi:hypothetical protein
MRTSGGGTQDIPRLVSSPLGERSLRISLAPRLKYQAPDVEQAAKRPTRQPRPRSLRRRRRRGWPALSVARFWR